MNNSFFRQVFGRGGGNSPERGHVENQGERRSDAAATASSDGVNVTRSNNDTNSNRGMRLNPQEMFASFVGVAQDFAGVAAAAGAATAAMAGVDAAAVEAAIAASLREHEQRHGGGGGPFHNHATSRAPPASNSFIRNLPLIEVRKEDLVDPANRECCICLEEHALHGRAVRLPCAHLFHRHCIIDWLANHSCTCPVCRYELPTDDAKFERHRQERMRHRKPRFARHELERLTNKELKQLLLPASSRRPNQQQQRQRHFVDRAELIDHLVESGAVDLVAAPPPVEYRLSVLKAMKASELRRVMNEDAGVYFDPSEVVEKQDMINIFLCSGRLTVLPEENEVQADQVNQYSDATFATDMEVDEEEAFVAEAMEVEEDRKPAAVPRRPGPVVETVLPDEVSSPTHAQQQQQQDLREDTSLVMEENDSFVEPVVVLKNNEQKLAYSRNRSDINAANNDGGEQNTPLSQTAQTEEEETNVPAAKAPSATMNEESQSTSMESDHRSRCRKRPLNENNSRMEENASNSSSSDGCAPSSYSYSASSLLHCSSNNEDGEDYAKSCQASADACMRTSFQNLSVSELRQLGQRNGVDLAGCIEKHEMVKKLSSSVSNHSSEATAATESTTNNNNNNSDENHVIPDSLFNEWGVTEILLAASLLNIDLLSSPSPASSSSFNHSNNSSRHGSLENGSTSRDRSQLIQSLLQASRDRPHVGRYLEALAPLMRLTVPQLRARARAERVTVSDCLEKGDLLRRLLKHSIASTTTAARQQDHQNTTVH